MSNVLPFAPPRPPQPERQPPPYPTNLRLVLMCGWLVIGGVFGGFGTWATVAPLSSAAIAPGIVVVDSNRKSVQHLEGGVIREILVRDGDVVEQGQVLLRLDGASIRAAMAALEPMLQTNRAYHARLIAERDDLAEVAFPDDLLSGTKTDPKVEHILAGQRRIFTTRRNALTGEVELNANRLAQSRHRLDGLEQRQIVKQEELELVAQDLNAQRALFKQGYTTRKNLNATERALHELEAETADLASKIDEANRLIERYELEGEQIRKNFVEQVENELYQVEQEGYELTQRMRGVQDQNDRLDVRAPVAGVVVNMVAHTVGGVVAPGSRILDIVPQDDRLLIEAQVQPTDIDGVRPGLQADIRFPAFERFDVPHITGHVTMVSADRIVNDRTGSSHFVVRAQVDDGQLGKVGSLRLVPGMPAQVIINKGEGTLLGYLTAPVARVFWTAFRE
ncbi:MAG TPA: HlyD family type I secretion periplasmic adaptor subunit [Geminicoccaceae bacterium]|nr:HlyD family type I secretion periplasmic adaptor subunit [Geminicoccaceae bacterium]